MLAQVAASLQRQRLVEAHKSEQAAKQEEGAAAQVRVSGITVCAGPVSASAEAPKTRKPAMPLPVGNTVKTQPATVQEKSMSVPDLSQNRHSRTLFRV